VNRTALAVGVLCALLSSWRGWAEESPVLARVDGEPIRAGEVERQLTRVVQQRTLTPEARRTLRAETLHQLVNRRLVLRYLNETGLGVSPQDVDVALNRVRKQLEKQQRTLPDYLQSAGLTEAELRHTLAWQTAWQRCLDHHLTDANLERYFTQHRRDFDGTKLRVAHILFRVEPADAPAARDQALARAKKVLQEIQGGRLSFPEAVRTYSTAPSASSAGEIGEIGRHAPMPEAFSQMAFKLEQGQVSEPVVTSFGVHLIQCLEVQPGSLTWQEMRGDLERAVAQYLFQWMADRQRPKAKVEVLDAE
jgi:parvulin-like peptidyl-prolyl isomerase